MVSLSLSLLLVLFVLGVFSIGVGFAIWFCRKKSSDEILVEELLKGFGRINKDMITRIIVLENRIDRLEGKAKIMEDDGR